MIVKFEKSPKIAPLSGITALGEKHLASTSLPPKKTKIVGEKDPARPQALFQSKAKFARRDALSNVLLRSKSLLRRLSRSFQGEKFLNGSFFMVYQTELTDNRKRALFLLKNLLLIHLLVVAAMYFLSWMHREINNICFLESVCQCQGLLVRLYTGLKKAFDTWFFGQLAIYLNLFSSPQFKKYKLAKFSIFGTNFAILLTIFLAEKDKYVHTADLAQRANLISVLNVLIHVFFIGMVKERMKFFFILNHFWVPFWALLIFYSYLLSYLYMLPEIKLLFVRSYPNEGYNLFQLFCSVLNSVYLTLFFFLNRYYSGYLKRVGANKTPQIVATKFFITLHFSLAFASISQLQFDQWGFWISLGDYFFNILRYHTSFSVLGDTMMWGLLKLFNKKFVPDWSIDIEFYRLVGYQHIEMLLVFLPRIFYMIYFRRWFISGVKGEAFIKNCSLEMVDSLTFNLKGINILLGVALSTSLITFLVSRLRGYQLNIMHFEALPFLVRIVFLISLHSNVEFYFLIYRSI